jgi:hypothetical protein
MTGRAKWDAWNSAGKTYTSAMDAQHRYLEIARSLGWNAQANTSPAQVDTDEDDIWDKEDGRVQERSGMGNSVSTMAPPEEHAESGGAHGIVLSNDAPALKRFLDEHDGYDMNETDEFVCSKHCAVFSTQR